jgi:hypothetical protein
MAEYAMKTVKCWKRQAYGSSLRKQVPWVSGKPPSPEARIAKPEDPREGTPK